MPCHGLNSVSARRNASAFRSELICESLRTRGRCQIRRTILSSAVGKPGWRLKRTCITKAAVEAPAGSRTVPVNSGVSLSGRVAGPLLCRSPQRCLPGPPAGGCGRRWTGSVSVPLMNPCYQAHEPLGHGSTVVRPQPLAFATGYDHCRDQAADLSRTTLSWFLYIEAPAGTPPIRPMPPTLE